MPIRCTYNLTESGSCNNQNFGKKFCFYHEGVATGKFTPIKEKYRLSTLPSYNTDGSEGEETPPQPKPQ
jgi:hypothetical protein